MRALVIDDSRTMRVVLSRHLERLGFEVLQAGDGQEGLDILDAAGDDLPVLATVDWNMPVMDGLAFVKAARKREAWRGLTMMMVTTEAETGQIVRALAAGAHEYLTKPFSGEAFVEKVQYLGLDPHRSLA